MFISDDLKRENIQKSESLSKNQRLKIAVFKGHLPASSTLKKQCFLALALGTILSTTQGH